MSMNRNITLAIDVDLLDRARVLAARRRKSVSALVRDYLAALVEGEERYNDAAERLKARMRTPTLSVGARSWSREELNGRC